MSTNKNGDREGSITGNRQEYIGNSMSMAVLLQSQLFQECIW